jgi:RNA polymerase sigma-70 factor (ECF subfamily)
MTLGIEPQRAEDQESSLGALIERYRLGDPDGLRELMSAVYPLVNRFVFRLTGGGPERDDLVQNCLEQLCRAIPGFGGRSRVTTFLFAICHRVVRRHQRAERVRHFFRLRAEESLLPQQRPAPDDALEQTQALAGAARVLSRLGADERSVFVLHELENLPLAEIAQTLGCSTRTVKRRLHAARSKFLEPPP